MTDSEKCRRRRLPPGDHRAVLESIEVVPSTRYRDKLAREFIFSTGDGEISKVTGVLLRAGESNHAFTSALLGREVVEGEVVNYATLKGRKFQIVVAGGRFRPSFIESVRPLDG